jgi:hypothetical protein
MYTLTGMQLNDDWDYSSDDTIAIEVCKGLDLSTILPRHTEPSQLCFRCKELRLWSTNCSFWDSPEGLEEKVKKDACTLCEWLLQAVRLQSKGQREFVRFARVGSYLTIDDGLGRAIANIYTMPGMYKRSSKFTYVPMLLTIEQIPKRHLCSIFSLVFQDCKMPAA